MYEPIHPPTTASTTPTTSTVQLHMYFASRTDHSIPLLDFLRQRVDSPGNVVSDNITTFLKQGLPIQVARKAYDQQGNNEVCSPQSCPPLLCCLLPCLNNTPTMKAYNNNLPDTATVTRFYAQQGGAKRFVMDSMSLVVGDLLTVYEGDLVPADCRIVHIINLPLVSEVSLLFAPVSSQRQHRRRLERVCTTVDGKEGVQVEGGDPQGEVNVVEASNMLLCGSTLVSGTALCVVTATGENMVWSTMVRMKLWPVKDV